VYYKISFQGGGSCNGQLVVESEESNNLKDLSFGSLVARLETRHPELIFTPIASLNWMVQDEDAPVELVDYYQAELDPNTFQFMDYYLSEVGAD
jgi:hypothetical protein